jgi:L-fuculose-phosphate aldolase
VTAEWIEARRRAELVAAGALLARRGLIRGPEGNLSCRLDGRSILITPCGLDKGRLHGAELLRCDLESSPPPGSSSEAAIHFAAYAAAPALAALIHAHPPRLLGLDARGGLPDVELLIESRHLVGRIVRVPPLEPGSRELAEACRSALLEAPVAVLTRHGVLASGASVAEALLRVELVELLAAMTLDGGTASIQ